MQFSGSSSIQNAKIFEGYKACVNVYSCLVCLVQPLHTISVLGEELDQHGDEKEKQPKRQ